LTASYFSAIKLPKDEFVTALNIMLMSGAVFMALALGYYDKYQDNALFLSLVACAPVLVGVFVGEKIRSRINNELFHRIILGILVLMGLNLLRRAFL